MEFQRIAHPKTVKYDVFSYIIPAVALLFAFGLCVISWLRLCSQACGEGHTYRLYGFTFESIGLTFFPLLALMHLASRKVTALTFVTSWSICAALGAELVFLYIQKYKIGAWCPVCLAIAAALLLAALGYFYSYCKNFKISLEHETKGQIMKYVCKGLYGIVFFTLGLLLSVVGIGKEAALQAQENDIKEKIAFGNFNSPIEIYVFTDWECPACRALEPKMASMAPEILQKAKVTFVDDPVHDATLNFTPYNLSFMIYNKAQYLVLRQALTKLAEETKDPQESQIGELAAAHGTNYRPLSYVEVAAGSKYFDHLIEQHKVEGTPTVIITNKFNKKSRKLEASDITETNILKAIKTFSPH